MCDKGRARIHPSVHFRADVGPVAVRRPQAPSASGAGPPVRSMNNLSRPVDGTVRPSPRSVSGWMGGGRELAMAETALSRLSEDEHSIQLRRAVVASTIGTAIEWYDFFLYSTVTGLAFAKLFFPQSDPLVGTWRPFVDPP